jgi:hypothetical protein
MYSCDDPLEEADHPMPWAQIALAALWGVLALVVLSPVLAVLGVLAALGHAPSKFLEPPDHGLVSPGQGRARV